MVERFVGLDVSQRLTSVCILDEGVVRIQVTREAGLTAPRRMIAPSYFAVMVRVWIKGVA
jgi:hypothetical protein